MSAPVKPIPDGYHTITPYLIVKGAADAIEFYKKAFGAIERFRMPGPDGRVGHAELQFGTSAIMFGGGATALVGLILVRLSRHSSKRVGLPSRQGSELDCSCVNET